MKFIDFPQSACRFAIARADITPPVGIYHRMWGAAVHDRSAGVHRPLMATALMFQSPHAAQAVDRVQVLVTLDHCLMGREEISLLLRAISELSGFPREAVTVTFSHTHAAGLMLLDRQSLPGGELIPDYLSHLNSTVANLVAACQRNLAEAIITYGYGHCDLAAHRDFWDESNEQYVCGFNPETVADDTLLVARVTARDGAQLATVVNYACHPTTLAWDNQLISPDYPGAMREVVEQTTDVPCVFLQGASGDLGPREGFVGETDVADRNGRQLGYAALSVLESMPPPNMRFCYSGPVVSGATIGTWSYQPLTEERSQLLTHWQARRKTLEMSYRADLPKAKQLEAERDQWQADERAAQSAGNSIRANECRAMAERQSRLLGRLNSLPPGNTFPYEYVVWRMGDAIWVSVQGEPYSVLQTELRERFVGVPVVVASVSSHWTAAYLPPAEIYGREIYQESVAILQPGSLELLIKEVGNQIDELLHDSHAAIAGQE